MKSPMPFKASIPATLVKILGVVVVAALLVGAVIFIRPGASAQALPAAITCAAVASGDWNNSANWDCAAVPGADDAVIIDGQNIQVSADQAIKDVAIVSNGSLTVADAVTLTIGGKLDVSSPSSLLSIYINEADLDPSMGGTIAFAASGDQLLVTHGNTLNFWNLAKSGTGSLTVDACSDDLSECGGGFQVYNLLTLKGIQLRSAFDGVAFTFVTAKTPDISDVDVKDAVNQGAAISVLAGKNSGNTAGWKFAGLSSSQNPSMAEQQITLTMVLPDGVSQDSLTFMDGLVQIACNGSTGVVAVVDSAASCRTADLGVGSHTISVSFDGGKSAQVVQVVSRFTSLNLHANSPDSIAGKEVAFLANVMPANVPGNVTFKDGDTTLCANVAVDVASGNARCAVVLNGLGSHVITGEFVPSQANTESSLSAPLIQSVKNLSALSLLSSNASSNPFEVLTLTAQLASANASGTVDFMENGNLIAGCGKVTVSAGQAVCQTGGLGSGRHAITAYYSGDATNFSASSAVVGQLVKNLFYIPQLFK